MYNPGTKKFNNIAKKNFEILNLSNTCESNCIDATKFDRYNDFDIFFLFNPFEDELYEKVIDALIVQCSQQENKKFIICYGGANLPSIQKYPNTKKIYEGSCPHRHNSINIYQLN